MNTDPSPSRQQEHDQRGPLSQQACGASSACRAAGQMGGTSPRAAPAGAPPWPRRSSPSGASISSTQTIATPIPASQRAERRTQDEPGEQRRPQRVGTEDRRHDGDARAAQGVVVALEDDQPRGDRRERRPRGSPVDAEAVVPEMQRRCGSVISRGRRSRRCARRIDRQRVDYARTRLLTMTTSARARSSRRRRRSRWNSCSWRPPGDCAESIARRPFDGRRVPSTTRGASGAGGIIAAARAPRPEAPWSHQDVCRQGQLEIASGDITEPKSTPSPAPPTPSCGWAPACTAPSSTSAARPSRRKPCYKPRPDRRGIRDHGSRPQGPLSHPRRGHGRRSADKADASPSHAQRSRLRRALPRAFHAEVRLRHRRQRLPSLSVREHHGAETIAYLKAQPNTVLRPIMFSV